MPCLANQDQATSVATVERDQPRVRKFVLRFAEETGFISIPAHRK